MKPFNLEGALAGAKLITKGGQSVTGFKKRGVEDDKIPYCAIIEGAFREYSPKGEFIPGMKNPLDLMMSEDIVLGYKH